MRLPLGRDEGPLGLIVCPSRELARQTHDIVAGYAAALAAEGYPPLRGLLAIGGIDMKAQFDLVKGEYTCRAPRSFPLLGDSM